MFRQMFDGYFVDQLLYLKPWLLSDEQHCHQTEIDMKILGEYITTCLHIDPQILDEVINPSLLYLIFSPTMHVPNQVLLAWTSDQSHMQDQHSPAGYHSRRNRRLKLITKQLPGAFIIRKSITPALRQQCYNKITKVDDPSEHCEGDLSNDHVKSMIDQALTIILNEEKKLLLDKYFK